jgi:hypothetical protein
MTDVTREQFETVTDAQVRHRPTGATISAYRYDEPTRDKIAGDLKVNWGRAGDRLDNGDEYEREHVAHVAIDLLTELAIAEAERQK